MRNIIFVLTSLIFIITPYQKGLFFDEDFYLIHVLIGLIFIPILIFSMRGKTKFLTGYYFIFLIPMTYYVSFFFAESPDRAMENILRWITYVVFFLIILYISQNNNLKKSIHIVIYFTGLWISLHAFLAIIDVVHYQDAVLWGRVAGVFQYPNTFAVFLGGFLLYQLLILLKNNWTFIQSVILAFPLVLYGSLFLFTYSRGAWVIIPVIWFLTLLFLRVKEQIKFFISTILLFVGSVLTFSKLDQAVQPGWKEALFLTFVSLLMALAIGYINLLVDRTKKLDLNMYWARASIPVAIVVIILLLFLDINNKGLIYGQLPGSIQERINDVTFDTHSVQGRNAFLKDAWEMSKDSPYVGYGGDGWRVLFTQYQDVPYYSNEVHNGYLENLLNTGWFGFIVFISFLLLGIYLMYKNLKQTDDRNEQLMIIGSASAVVYILAHSFIDFNMSYGTIWFFILMWIAVSQPNQLYEFKLNRTGKFLLYIPITIVILLGMYQSIKLEIAKDSFAKIQQSRSSAEVIKNLETSINNNPRNIDYRLTAANYYFQLAFTNDIDKEDYIIKALENIDQALKYEPHNAGLLHSVGTILVKYGQVDDGIKYINESIKRDHYNVTFYENSLLIKTNHAYNMVNKTPVESRKYAEQAINDYELMVEKMRIIDKIFESGVTINERNFKITPKARYFSGKSYYLLGDFEKGLETLKPVLNTEDPDMKRDAWALSIAMALKLNQDKNAQNMLNSIKTQFQDIEQKVNEYIKIAE